MMESQSFSDKYTSEAEKLQPGEDKKIPLSNDAYAIGQLLMEIKEELRRWH